jgi:hypothetical protein
MPNQPSSTNSMTDFQFGLKSQFSEALEVAQIAMDPELVHQRGEAFPPVLTAADYASQFFVRSSVTFDKTVESELTIRLRKSLLTWTGENFFELVPLPEAGSSGDVGFRITPQGMRTAIEACRDHAASLQSLANRVTKKL